MKYVCTNNKYAKKSPPTTGKLDGWVKGLLQKVVVTPREDQTAAVFNKAVPFKLRALAKRGDYCKLLVYRLLYVCRYYLPLKSWQIILKHLLLCYVYNRYNICRIY